jgi:predicted negative regulator of RcsB-dependent stress response
MNSNAKTINILFIVTTLALLAILGLVGWFYHSSLQTKDAQQLKLNVETVRSSLASAVYLAQEASALKVSTTFGEQTAGQLLAGATDSEGTILGDQYESDVTSKAEAAGTLANDYAKVLSQMLQEDDFRAAAGGYVPRLRELKDEASRLEDSL